GYLHTNGATSGDPIITSVIFGYFRIIRTNSQFFFNIGIIPGRCITREPTPLKYASNLIKKGFVKIELNIKLIDTLKELKEMLIQVFNRIEEAFSKTAENLNNTFAELRAIVEDIKIPAKKKYKPAKCIGFVRPGYITKQATVQNKKLLLISTERRFFYTLNRR
ncbi:MAG: hypothetical protein UD936_04000, partial [Acutalibacteraceae bacterium]|nr:hypothetical protein [Acutalibacteraceae bacterium]